MSASNPGKREAWTVDPPSVSTVFARPRRVLTTIAWPRIHPVSASRGSSASGTEAPNVFFFFIRARAPASRAASARSSESCTTTAPFAVASRGTPSSATARLAASSGTPTKNNSVRSDASSFFSPRARRARAFASRVSPPFRRRASETLPSRLFGSLRPKRLRKTRLSVVSDSELPLASARARAGARASAIRRARTSPRAFSRALSRSTRLSASPPASPPASRPRARRRALSARAAHGCARA